jgi:hypothetical protein
VRREHSGTQVRRSVQVVCAERGGGLLVMRRSGVRFPKAAQVERLISLVCSIAVARLSRATNATRRIRSERHLVTQGKSPRFSSGE